MSGKRTPETWFVDCIDKTTVLQRGPIGATVANCKSTVWNQETQEANAILIAAAPELEIAAKECLKNNGGPIDADDTVDGQAYIMVRRVDFDALEAAWKKATGLTPPWWIG